MTATLVMPCRTRFAARDRHGDARPGDRANRGPACRRRRIPHPHAKIVPPADAWPHDAGGWNAETAPAIPSAHYLLKPRAIAATTYINSN